MKIKLLILFFLLGNLYGISQSKFLVKANSIRNLAQEEANLFVEEFIMEDNSTLLIPDNIDLWNCTALKFKIGSRCKIIAKGENGVHGTNGISAGPTGGGDCSNGGSGENGTDGKNGTNGCNINFKIGIQALGSLEIITQGGRGGDGGSGGNGGHGTQGDCSRTCNGGSGGSAGSGGNNGQGGKAGNVKIEFWIVSDKNIQTPEFALFGADNNGIVVKQSGGNGGTGGKSGTPGRGGPGKDCQWPVDDRSHGPHGAEKGDKPKGMDGSAGSYVVLAIPNPGKAILNQKKKQIEY